MKLVVPNEEKHDCVRHGPIIIVIIIKKCKHKAGRERSDLLTIRRPQSHEST